MLRNVNVSSAEPANDLILLADKIYDRFLGGVIKHNAKRFTRAERPSN